ncbi:hypothetical protein DWB61_12200 [Ancylomarina euxinus]|uniref:Uncharacterized protein n=1 Tax=Ancylomarina euxinus TaxID=2283627 RepID=A0A425XZ86_9BACT|nr:hypothetical protein DWB61_12200 [Ancylomarina euxinus]
MHVFFILPLSQYIFGIDKFAGICDVLDLWNIACFIGNVPFLAFFVSKIRFTVAMDGILL